MSSKLPNGWQVAKLGELFDSGKVVVEKGIPLKKSEVTPGSIPVIAGGKTSPYNHNSSTHSISCITISSSGAYAGYVWFHSEPIWASDCSVIYSEHHLTEHLYYFLKANQARIYASQVGSGQPHVYPKDLKTLTVLLPPLQEQKAMAGILQKWDEAIEKTETLIFAKQKQFEWLLKRLIRGQQGSSGWQMTPISKVAKVVTGKTPPTLNDSFYGGSIPFVAPGDLGFSKYIVRAAKTLSLEGAKYSPIVPAGSSLFTCIGLIGKVGIASTELRTNQQINSAIPVNIDSEFLYYTLIHQSKRIEQQAATQVVPIVKKSDFESQKILVPESIEVQKAVAHTLNTAQREIDLLKHLVDLYRTQKRGLMQKLLTGEWRV